MPRISPERIFKSHFPKATIERRSTNGGEVFYLVRQERGAYMSCGAGHTKPKAWASACAHLGLTALKTDETIKE